MRAEEFIWQYHSGRDGDGDRFETVQMVHGSGRIILKIRCPEKDENWWRIYFYVPKVLFEFESELPDYTSLEDAKRYAELIVTNWDTEIEAKLLGQPNAGKKGDKSDVAGTAKADGDSSTQPGSAKQTESASGTPAEDDAA